MPRYHYRAVNGQGQIVCGLLAAESLAQLDRTLTGTGLELIAWRVPVHWRLPALQGRVNDRELISFCHHLEVMEDAGVPVLQSLEQARDHAGSKALRDALTEICRDVGEGAPLSQAFARQKRHMPRAFAAMLGAAEKSGNMAQAFHDMHAHARWAATLRARTQRALRYPAFLLLLAAGVITFMMATVVPQVMNFVADSGGGLPWHARALLAVAGAVASYWWLMAGTAIAAAIAVKALHAAGGRMALLLDRALLALPGLGRLLRKFQMAGFARHFAVLQGSGINTMQALQDAAGLVGNSALAQDCTAAVTKILRGMPMTDAFAAGGLYNSTALQIIRTGEQSGKQAHCWQHIASLYEQEAQDATERFVGMLEPALTLLIGLIMAWLVLSVLGPVYASLNNLGI